MDRWSNGGKGRMRSVVVAVSNGSAVFGGGRDSGYYDGKMCGEVGRLSPEKPGFFNCFKCRVVTRNAVEGS